MKQNINVWEYAPQILQAVGNGILLTTQADGQVDTMTIGWGHLGVEWYKPIFIAYVRQSRHTKSLLDKNPEFTVNIPLGSADKEIKTVGIVGGAGSSELFTALRNGCDCLITGEVHHHQAYDALENGIALVEVSHSVEALFKEYIKKMLSSQFANVEFILSKKDVNPFKCL